MTMAQTITQKQLFLEQAPNFNFELNSDELLSRALEVGFVTKVGDDAYLINEDY